MVLYMEEELSRVSHERDILAKILREVGCMYGRCRGRDSLAYYRDYYDDSKIKCSGCMRDTCVSCIANHCNMCDNYFNVVCKECVKGYPDEKSKWCDKCKKQSCNRCWNILTCYACMDVSDEKLGTCPFCYLGQEDTKIYLCKCGLLLCRTCECTKCILTRDNFVIQTITNDPPQEAQV